MPPNSRPPLSSRIRASFDGKRSKSEVTSPTTNGFITQDPDSLRFAIDEAINSEAFQTAIAANLAKLIKPSIKSALDTIQPVVEAVYNHEMLLRKTNQSVENLLERIDTVAEPPSEENEEGDPSTPITPRTPRKKVITVARNSTDVEGVKQLFADNNEQNEAKLSELSTAVQVNNSKIAEILEGIAGINAALWPTRETLEALKSSSEQSNTTTSVMQAQLDQLNADVGVIIEAVGSDLGKNVKAITHQVAAQDTSLLSSHSTKLDAISTDLAGLKGHGDTMDILRVISADVEALKGDVQASIAASNEHFGAMSPQLANVLTHVEAHSSKLTDISPGDTNAEVLAAVQKSNDSHAAHALALDKIKERGLGDGSQAAPASDSPETVAALQSLAADLAILKENIQTGLATSNGSISDVGIKVDDVLTTLEAHRSADPSADILAAVQRSNESHASHTEALESIKSIGVESRNIPPSDNSNVSSLDPHFATIIAKLDSHSSALEDLKASGTPGTEIVATSSSNDGLEAQIATVISTLESHTTLLTEIKDDVSAEILTVLHDINEAHASQNTVLAEIRESDVSDEILTALHACNDSHANHTAVLTDVHAAVQASNDSHASHTGVLDEIKATRSIEATPSTDPPSTIGALDTQIGAILTTLEDQNATLAAIKDAADASNESHVSHTSTLAEIKATRNVEPSEVAVVPSGSSDLDAQIGAIITTLEVQYETLSAIKDVTATSHETLGDLKTAVSGTTDSHAAHHEVLAELKDITSASNDFHSSHMMTLSEIKEAVTSATGSHASHSADLAEIKDASKAANDLHASHITALTELKADRSTAAPPADTPSSNLGELETHITTILAKVDAQSDTLSAIKEATASPEVLATVKESHEDIVGNIAALKAIIEESRAGLEDHGAAVKDLHESTKASHSEITTAIGALALGGAAGAGAGVLASKEDDNSAELLEEVKAVHALLEQSSTSIETIKEAISATPRDDGSSAEILEEVKAIRVVVEKSSTSLDTMRETTDNHNAAVKDLQQSTKESHSGITEAIGALALGGAAGAGAGVVVSKDDDSSSAEILEEVKAVRAIIEQSSVSVEAIKEATTSMAAQIDINHTTVTTSITTLSDELKAEIDATGTDLSTSIEVLSGDVKAIDLHRLTVAVDECGNEIKGLSATMESLDGVHLNAMGLEQLKRHATAGEHVPRPVSRRENWWKGEAEHSPDPILHESVESEPVERKRSLTPTIQIHEPELGQIPEEEELETPPIVDAEPIEPVEPGDLVKPVEPANPADSLPKTPTIVEPIEEADPGVSEPVTTPHLRPEVVDPEMSELILEKEPSPEPKEEDAPIDHGEHSLPTVDGPEPLSPDDPPNEDLISAVAKGPSPGPKEENPPSDQDPAPTVDEPEPVSLEEPPIEEPVVEVAKQEDPPNEDPEAEVAKEEDPEDVKAREEIAKLNAEIMQANEPEDLSEVPEHSPTKDEDELEHAEPTPSAEVDLEDDSATVGTESASTSAIASPLSPSFPGESSGGKKGKKGKKAPKEKKPKKGKNQPFVFDPDDDEEPPAA